MKRAVYLMLIAALAISAASCNKESAATKADSLASAATPPAVVDKIKVESKTVIPAGTKVRVALIDSVSSDKSRPGDSFMASLSEPIVINGKTVLAKGTKVRGRVIDAKESGRVKGRASLGLTLTEIVRDGKSITLSTRPYTTVAEATKKRDAAIIGGGAGVGAAIGAIAGGGKGAAIGAAVGGGSGTGAVLATKGKEVRFGPEHLISFTLANPVEI